MPKVGMTMSVAFVFPGQGAQYAGMGKALVEKFPVAAKTLEEADAALGFALSKLILAGPEDQLRLTYYTQPALLTVSIAALRVFQEQISLQPAFVAGHSLGEYTALVASGALSFADAVQLVYKRGRFMDEAVPAGEGTMAAVLGADIDLLTTLCKSITAETGQVVEVANLNCPGQVTVSGATSAVDALVPRATEAKARRALKLDVSGPFHSSLMRPAAAKLAQELEAKQWAEMQVPLVANVSANAITTVHAAIEALKEQLAAPVRWEDSVRFMTGAGVTTFVEFGAGNVLSGLIRKTDKQAKVFRVEDLETLADTVQGLVGEVSVR